MAIDLKMSPAYLNKITRKKKLSLKKKFVSQKNAKYSSFNGRFESQNLFFARKLDFPVKITYLLHMALNLCKLLSAPACTEVIYECGD